MKIQIISVGKLTPLFNELANRYKKMTSWRVKDTELSNSKKSSVDQIKQDEALSIRSKISDKSYVIVLDERGEQINSQTFAAIFSDQMIRSKNIDFIIGGAYGLDASMLKSANMVLGLSQMTLPHQFARVLLLEQIYRAQTIIDNHPYHK